MIHDDVYINSVNILLVDNNMWPDESLGRPVLEFLGALPEKNLTTNF
eukprot:CAMPEP_0204827296 /NCGR_PEP_ID=MMETSP1346-20131115/4787_1 /ASSEMBLY_ACC=CAM_ASM_000771 /TAXON_ID=215587 /ORGANISM="Aplanochytrium stocchinoi, Strain GSBS06" /LENGTH=46 /DNA_ID= /DNA_START= /DNA_END= /DNA_ORIENTATION=